MIKEIDNNSYDYVDLDLPSGTLWATCNVGADKPTESGFYFQWGEVFGYNEDQVGIGSERKKFSADWSDYIWNLSSDGKTFTKYTKPGDTLKPEDDPANFYMGGSWHIPSPEQIQELIANTISTWKTFNGFKGMTFTSKKDPLKSIFIPAVGDAMNGSIGYSGKVGNIWSSMLDKGYVRYGQGLYFDSKGAYLIDCYARYHGFSVRGVLDKNNMNENLNLVEILKDVSPGTKLWSPICGECEFYKIRDGLYPILCKAKRKGGYTTTIQFTINGYLEPDYEYGECMLFPSKNNRDWSTFKVPKPYKHFEPFQKVLIKGWREGKLIWIANFYSYYDKATGQHFLISDYVRNDAIIPYSGNEDKLGQIVE